MAEQSVWSQLIDVVGAGYVVNQKEKTSRAASDVAVQGPYPGMAPQPVYYQGQPVARYPGVPAQGVNFTPAGQSSGMSTLAMAAAGYMLMSG